LLKNELFRRLVTSARPEDLRVQGLTNTDTSHEHDEKFKG